MTSANWGGDIGNFFTGGLNLQIEHHLFPAISFMHYPAISRIVADECRKRGIQYAHYDTLPQIVARFTRSVDICLVIKRCWTHRGSTCPCCDDTLPPIVAFRKC